MTKAPHRAPVPEWAITAAWFIAGVGATGAFWFFLASGSVAGVILSAGGTLAAIAVAIAFHVRNDRLRASNQGSSDRLPQLFRGENKGTRMRVGSRAGEETHSHAAPLPASVSQDATNQGALDDSSIHAPDVVQPFGASLDAVLDRIILNQRSLVP
jgi:hypothetical protein